MLRVIKYLSSFLAIIIFCLAWFYVIQLEGGQNVYYSAAVAKGKEIEQHQTGKNVNLLFVGDIMFDRGVASHTEKYGSDSLFAKVEQLFQGNDAIIGNLEGTITDNPSISIKDKTILRFTFNPIFLKLLDRLHLSAFSLANNHSLDFGKDGYEQTTRNLQNVGIIPFGSPNNDKNLSTKINLYGKIICLVGYHDLFTFNQKPALEEIKSIREVCSYVILFTHWGDEYKVAPSERQKKLAREFIDAGADLIIGAHPHVIETLEIYKNKAIFYSLGNFIFDQDFSFATKRGLAVHVELSDYLTRFTLVPISIEQGEISIANLEEWPIILSALINDNLPQDIASSVMYNQEFVLEN